MKNHEVIVISCALPKSASTLLFQYTCDLVDAACCKNGLRELVRLTNVGDIKGMGGFIASFDDATVDSLLQLTEKHGPVVVKSHSPLHPNAKRLIEQGQAVATFIHRDPRDAILSAMDNCRSTRATDFPMFQEFASLSSSLPVMGAYCKHAREWIESGLALVLTYKQLLQDPFVQLQRIASHIQIDVTDGAMKSSIEHHNTHLNHLYNTGKLERFRQEMSAEAIAICNEQLGDLIVALGYEL
ncbi:MAG: sulfotransferase domain-containing protein [Chromatiaceae bacterium]|nr:sulfotransferase domain-containing protein [Chromatiaceae bacterium]